MRVREERTCNLTWAVDERHNDGRGVGYSLLDIARIKPFLVNARAECSQERVEGRLPGLGQRIPLDFEGPGPGDP